MKKKPVFVGVVLCLLLILSAAGCGLSGSKPGKDSTPAQPPSPTAGQSKETALSDILYKGRGIKSMSYDFVVTSPQATQTGKVWLDENRIKTDSTIEGKRIVTFYDRTTNTAVTYYPEQNQAVKLTAGAGSNKTPSPSDHTGNLDPAKVKFIRNEMCDGIPCRVLELIETGSQGQNVWLWVREDLGLPAKVEVTAQSGEKTVMEYRNLKVGPIPPETFELPPGVQVTDLGQMLNRLPANLPNR